MPILATLNKEKFGHWGSLLAYLQDLNRRESGSLAALAAALTAPAEEQKELGEGEGVLVLADIASDLRVQKGSRLAAARCAVEAGASGPVLATLFIGAGELATDPRLGATARRLVETGIPAVLAQPGHEAARVSAQAGAFAKALQAAESVVGAARLKELLAAPAGHAGVNAGRFALGYAPLAAAELDAWKALLKKAATAHKSSPMAARRIGMAPPWPPNVPDAFKDLIAEAEKATANVVAIDAAKGGVITGRAGPPAVAPARPAPNAPAIQSRAPSSPRAGAIGAPLRPGARTSVEKPGPVNAAAEAAPSMPPVAAQAPRLQEPIKRSPFRRPIGTVVEGPFVAPTRKLPPVAGQQTPGAVPPPDAKPPVPPIMPGLAALPTRSPEKQPRFDARGKKIPETDRWRARGFEWEEPVLPPSELKPIPKVARAPGPFAARLQSLFDDKPEAVDRLCAAADAQAALKGVDAVEAALAAELSRPAWKDRRAPPSQVQRLHAIATDQQRPAPWRKAAAALLHKLSRID